MSRGTRRQEAGLQAHCSDSPEQGASVSAGSRGGENKDSVGWGRERAGSVAHVEWGRGREGAQMKPWVGLERFRQAMALWPALQKRHWGFAWRGDWRTQRGSGKVGYEGCSSPRDRWGSHGLRVQRWRRRETGKLDRYLSSSEDVSACHMAAVNGGPGQ